MRLFVWVVFLIAMQSYAFANSGYPIPDPSGEGPSTASHHSSTNTNDFGNQVQQKTADALKTFHGVNYSKLSGSASKEGFYGSSLSNDDDQSAKDPDHLFNVFSGN